MILAGLAAWLGAGVVVMHTRPFELGVLRSASEEMGAPLGVGRPWLAALLGGLGLVGLALNGAYLWQFPALRGPSLPWFALAGYAGLVALLSALDEGAEAASPGGAAPVALLFWVALLVLGARSLREMTARPAGGQALALPAWLGPLNSLLAGCVALLLLQTSLWTLDQQVASADFRHGLTVARNWGRSKLAEVCLREFPLERDGACLRASRALAAADADQLYALAALRLAAFEAVEPVNVLPETYAPGSPIILQSPSPWLNIYMREMLLSGIDEAALFHVMPEVPAKNVPPAEAVSPPLGRRAETLSPAALAEIEALISDHPQVWLLTTPEMQAQEVLLRDFLAERRYFVTPFPLQDDPYRLARLRCSAFSSCRPMPPPKRSCVLARREFD
ncbi:MAG: hypothetical protein HC915_06010 [Anaerolineae bacterium]|nr:hypothetical protein [Anaerolineae bacterium]